MRSGQSRQLKPRESAGSDLASIRFDQVSSVRFVAETWHESSALRAPGARVGLDHGQQPLGLDEEASRVGTDRVTHAPHVSTDLAEIVSMQWFEVSDTVA
jgi:hypothetical protein